MKSFSDMGVKLKRRFEGDRIRIEKVEGDEIIIHDYEIRESKIKREDEIELLEAKKIEENLHIGDEIN